MKPSRLICFLLVVDETQEFSSVVISCIKNGWFRAKSIKLRMKQCRKVLFLVWSCLWLSLRFSIDSMLNLWSVKFRSGQPGQKFKNGTNPAIHQPVAAKCRAMQCHRLVVFIEKCLWSFYYWPRTFTRERNVFSHICLSLWGGGGGVRIQL